MTPSLGGGTRASNGSAVGGPEPGGPLSDRQKTFLQLLGALVVVGVLAVRVGALWDWAWETHGVGRTTIFRLVDGLGLDIDVVVLLPFGVVTGWVVLFIVDRTKTLQRWLAAGAYLLLVAWIVVVENRWVTYVSWGDLWYVFLLGVIVGVVSGVVPSLFRRRQLWEFPLASVGLFLVALTLCLVAMLDVHLFGPEPLSVEGTTVLPGPQSALGTVIDVVSTVGFVGLFGWFVLYSEVRSVAVVSTARVLGLAVMAGLLDHTQRGHDGRSGPGGPSLSDAKRPLAEGRRPEADLAFNGDDYYEIVYLPPTAPRRWVLVSASPVDIGALGEETLARLGNRTSNQSLGRRTLSFFIANLLPGRLERSLRSETGLLVDRIGDAAVLLFVTSVRDLDGYEPGVDPSVGQLSASAEIERFTELCSQLDDGKKRVVVVTDAEEALPLHGATSVTDEGFAEFVRGQLLDLDDSYTVVPVSWAAAETDDELIAGIEAVRRALDH